MMFFPLVNIIGYEFSVINGLLFFFLSGFWAIKNFSLDNTLNPSIDYYFKKNISLIIISFFIPLNIGSFSTILFSECPFGDGLLFYLVISLPNIFFGYVIGLYISVLFKKYRTLSFIIIFILILFIPLIEFYFYPQVYFYNLIFGFFPGTIYDEDLTVNNLLLSYRIFQIAFFIALFFTLTKIHRKSFNKSLSLFLILFLSVILFLIKPYLNFSTNLKKVESELKGKIETEHFEIIYSQSIDKNSALYLALLHEYYFENVINRLDIKYHDKITSIVFKDENEKRKLIGAGRADIAKPWLKQIFLNYPTFDETLKHEIVHVIAGKFGTTPFKVADKINPTLIEGLAMAIENDYDGFDVHHMAKIASDAGYKVSIDNLFSGLNFFTNYSSVSYIYAGSFIKYLIDTYGIGKMKELYSDMNFNKYYEKDLQSLEKEYEAFLSGMKINYYKNMAQLYFGGKTIFKKYCVRTATFKTKEAISLFKKGNYYGAEKLFEKVYNYSGSFSALSGLANSKLKLQKYQEAEKILFNERNKFIDSPYKFNLELLLGDTYVLNNKIELAKSLYDSLLTQNPSIDYYNETFVRTYLLSDSKSQLNEFILGDRKKRFELLKKLNNEKLIYPSIPLMIYYCGDNSELKDLILSLQTKIEVSDKITSFAVMKLSQAAARLGYYEIAKDLAVKALAYKEDELLTHSLTENLKLINWLVNFSEETLKKISIK